MSRPEHIAPPEIVNENLNQHTHNKFNINIFYLF